MRLTGHGPSRENPNLCRHCTDLMPRGGAEVDIAVVFADVRGSTAIGERLSPSEFAALLNHFYAVATRVLLAHDAVIDKMIGDEVMALFVRGFAGEAYRQKAVRAAVALMQALGRGSGEPWLPVGAGVHVGIAYVGNVGSEKIIDFTAVGDTVNTGARLQAQAEPGEIVLSEDAYDSVRHEYSAAAERTVELKGKEHPLPIRILHLTR